MAKQQSLAASGGALSTAVQLPSVFSAPPDKLKGRLTAPYVTFAHHQRADEWKRLNSKFGAVAEGDMFFMSEDRVEALQTAKLGLLCCKQCWVEKNPAGDLLRVSWKERPKPFKEQVEAVVLVYFDDVVVPANMSFRTTRCGAVRNLSDALIEAAHPSWGDKGAAYKETFACAQPFMRFYGVCALGPARNSRESGLPYRPLLCDVKPTSVPEWRLLKAFVEDPASNAKLEDAAARFESSVHDLRAKEIDAA